MNNWGVAQSGSLIVDSLFFDSYLFKFYSFTKVYEINSCDWRPGDVYFLHFLYFKSYPMASSGLGLKKTDSGIRHLPCRSAQCNTYWLIDWWKPEAYVCSLFSKGAFHFHFNICAAAMTSVFVTFFHSAFRTLAMASPPLPMDQSYVKCVRLASWIIFIIILWIYYRGYWNLWPGASAATFPRGDLKGFIFFTNICKC